MMKFTLIFILPLLLNSVAAMAQHGDQLPLKIKHAEPMYNDIVRDLGALKGEKEINIGYEIEKNATYGTQGGFIEYEFAPVNRLAIELEIPFQFKRTVYREDVDDPAPRNKIKGIKPALQYTFLVNKQARLSMAAGAIYELHLHSFPSVRNDLGVLKGNSFNPFLIVAKRWGSHLHTMIYTGPEFYQDFDSHQQETAYLLNISMHYMLGSNFLGIEMNQEYGGHDIVTILRPQAKVQLEKQLAIGIASGIPIAHQTSGYSFLARLIYEL